MDGHGRRSVLARGRVWAEHLPYRWALTPARVTLLYYGLGFAALYGSDVLLGRYVSEPLLGQLQALKGAVEVLLTGVLIYGLTLWSRAPLKRTRKRLRRQREELDVLHRVLRHNLRNDLATIRGYTDLLRRGEEADAEHAFTVIEATIEDVTHYVDQAKRINAITERDGGSTTIDLADVVPIVVERHPHVTQAVDLTVELPEEAEVEANHMVPEALSELVTNAVVHNEADRPAVTIAVDPGAGPAGRTEVAVADDGPGIPEEVVAILREREHDELVHLDGMGLWFVSWTVADSGGDLRIESNPAGGTTVRMWLPTGLSIPLSGRGAAR